MTLLHPQPSYIKRKLSQTMLNLEDNQANLYGSLICTLSLINKKCYIQLSSLINVNIFVNFKQSKTWITTIVWNS